MNAVEPFLCEEKLLIDVVSDPYGLKPSLVYLQSITFFVIPHMNDLLWNLFSILLSRKLVSILLQVESSVIPRQWLQQFYLLPLEDYATENLYSIKVDLSVNRQYTWKSQCCFRTYYFESIYAVQFFAVLSEVPLSRIEERFAIKVRRKIFVPSDLRTDALGVIFLGMSLDSAIAIFYVFSMHTLTWSFNLRFRLKVTPR